MPPAITIKNLTKIYEPRKGAEKVALDDVSLEIPKGSFFGLLGPNGAGKSTLINIIAGLVNKTSGKVEVCGIDIDKDLRKAKYHLGVVPQELILDPFFTVREALEFHAGYYGIPKSQRKTDEIIKALSLEDKKHTSSRRLSGGMRRRLLIGKALVHNPEVLILDEPTAGVDIELRQSLWEYAKKLNKQGTTIVLTTHYLEEAEQLCDEIAIINHGKIVAHDKKKTLLKKLNNKRIVIHTQKNPEKVPPSLKSYNPVMPDDNTVEIRYNPEEIEICDILKDIHDSGLKITDLVTQDTKLEDIFLQLTKAA
ncbi:MAG: multidrug ABC transporter ATP-binding protein [Alphaproteobacteria bacterium CG11_big_fil_rev_8_21_14_0_20_44_7]|nr:MAG: multidrug ABC transporter ATP-binding protein [Alphaproteobacteria bacterium CG11_big_fil_rev_8_21_14_0_20_44_7]